THSPLRRAPCLAPVLDYPLHPASEGCFHLSRITSDWNRCALICRESGVNIFNDSLTTIFAQRGSRSARRKSFLFQTVEVQARPCGDARYRENFGSVMR